MFDVIVSLDKGLFSAVAASVFAGSHLVVVAGEPGDGAVVQNALDPSSGKDEALHYIAPAIFSTLHTLLEKCQP